ncbi:MAG: HDIG domain-containing protein [Candidatus Methanoperedens sp.]|nr:HDIG domain-containing protein [Candidatus Methanoperedens sp.]
MNEEEAIALLVSSGCSSGVIEHCRAVAHQSRKIADGISECARKKGAEIDLDSDAIFLGGMLHDIGRSRSHDIDHAVEGAKIARENNLNDKLVNIIERHIGAGISRDEAAELGLPARDYIPLTIEEKIIAHADNLVFGSRVRTLDELVLDLRKKKIDEKIIQRVIELNNEINAMLC